MISLIAYALAPRLGARAAQFVAYGITAALAAAALYLAYSWAWDRGRDHQRDIDERRIDEVIAERNAAMEQAGARDAAEAGVIEDHITQNRKELDDATASIPDRPLSDRQRARACRELMQQGKRCPPPPAAPGASGG